MSQLATVRAALESSYDAIGALCASLDEKQWSTQSLCPDWTVRGVVTHLAGIEAVLTGWLPEDNASAPSFDPMAAFVAATADLDDATFAAVTEVFDARRREVAALTQADVERPSWTPVGPKTYGDFMDIRVFDFWVHERDITTPLGIETDDGGLAAEIAVDQVAASLGYIVGKKVGVPDGKSIAFHLTGPVRRDLYAMVDGKAKVVDGLDSPDVEVTTDSKTFVQLACGRIDPQGPIDSGAITWTGDAELGDRAARNLRYTM